MADAEFLAEHPETFVGHLSSPSVVRRDGRYFMAFVGLVDDRSLWRRQADSRARDG
jgi:hypothetical protein